MLKRVCFLTLLVISGFQFVHAQTTIDTARASKKVRILAVPVVFYTPDTKLGLGAGGILTWKSKAARYPNSVNFSFAWTVRKQLLFWFPFQYYAKNTKWQAYGELGYFRYIFDYFGIGNRVPASVSEKYEAQFPRLRLTALKTVIGNQHFAGLRLSYDEFKITKVDSSGLLLSEKPLGNQGGQSSGLGIVWLSDTRDHRFYPRRGVFGEASVYLENKATGSDFAFVKCSYDLAFYHAFGKFHTLALQTATTLTLGDAPFFGLATLGGTKRLRGYTDGRYRDKHAVLLQTEWRTQLYRRLGAVVFAGTGAVWGASDEQPVLRPNYGAGLRITLDKKQHLNVRLDYGLGSKGNSGFYLTIGEAF
jgi:outer membrane protein assembly factor BamA